MSILHFRSSSGLSLAEEGRLSSYVCSCNGEPPKDGSGTPFLRMCERPQRSGRLPARPASQPLGLLPGQTQGAQAPSEVFPCHLSGWLWQAHTAPWGCIISGPQAAMPGMLWLPAPDQSLRAPPHGRLFCPPHTHPRPSPAPPRQLWVPTRQPPSH